VKGRRWEFSVGWACTDREIDAIDRVPIAVGRSGIDQDRNLPDDTWVTDITGLLGLSQWHEKIPGLRILARGSLHPKYTERTSDRDKARGRRYQLGAVNAAIGQVAWLDARHRSHVHVEAGVKQAKAIGPYRWPSRHWNVNVAWSAVVAMAGSLLAAFRHLGLPDGDLRKASIQTVRFRLFEVPGRIIHGQHKTWLHLPTDWPWTPDLRAAWQTIKTLPIPVRAGTRTAIRTVSRRSLAARRGWHDR
jgi:hypothetical protein